MMNFKVPCCDTWGARLKMKLFLKIHLLIWCNNVRGHVDEDYIWADFPTVLSGWRWQVSLQFGNLEWCRVELNQSSISWNAQYSLTRSIYEIFLSKQFWALSIFVQAIFMTTTCFGNNFLKTWVMLHKYCLGHGKSNVDMVHVFTEPPPYQLIRNSRIASPPEASKFFQGTNQFIVGQVRICREMKGN